MKNPPLSRQRRSVPSCSSTFCGCITMVGIKRVLAFLLLLTLFSSLVVNGLGQASKENTVDAVAQLDKECGERKNCSQCIQTVGCWWCKDKRLSLDSKRCFGNDSQTVCDEKVNPQGKIDVDSRKIKGTHTIHPQVVQMELRKGTKMNISIQYTDEKNRPLDLYIVMDLSCSMIKHKEKVVKLTEDLAKNLRTLTSKLQIGFGTFVDKPLSPFGYLGDLVPTDKNKSCSADSPTVETVPAYSFRNHLKLTNNITEFTKQVESAGISSNIDFPEGTLDGLLQSVVCSDRIGWRSEKGSRKLIVISTDGSYHLSGDGKLVGVFLPHDGECYVDSSNIYTKADVLDYPSVSLIKEKIRENDVFVIFAVTKDQEPVYEELSRQLHPFALTQGIDNDNNSIINVIETEYKKLVNTVKLLSIKEANTKDYIDVKVYSRCPDQQDFAVGDQCNGLAPGQNVSFKIEVELKACPSNRDLNKPNQTLWNSSITIYPQSSREDYMTINLMMLCGCDCELENPLARSSVSQPKSTECSNNGYLRCGTCDCVAEWGGPYCNCTVDEAGHSCTDPESSGLQVCNGRGTCDNCGKCKCDAKAYSGKYCECDNTDCPWEHPDQGLCNVNAKGGSQGNCQCKSPNPRISQCYCKSGFEGPRCQCTTSYETCQDPNSSDSFNKTCNGVGSCDCGKCLCRSGYKGTYCGSQHAQINGSCESARKDTEKCVECLVSKNGIGETDGTRSEMCENECNNIAVKFIPRLERVPVYEEENVCEGSFEDGKGCRVDFIIRERNITSKTIHLEIESGEEALREKCPTPPPIFEIVIGIVAAMVLIGVVLLFLWKIVTHIQDRKEYERFTQAAQAAAWNTHDNPLYKGTTSQFKNPAYVDYQESEHL